MESRYDPVLDETEDRPLIVIRRRHCNARLAAALLAPLVIIGLFAGLITAGVLTQGRDWEASFLDNVQNTSISEFLKDLTNQSHIAGSEGDYYTALYVRDKLLEFGVPEVEVEAMSVLLSYPKENQRAVQLLAGPDNKAFNCSLKEEAYDIDPSTLKPAPDTFLAYSHSGDVTAELVYVNYGRYEDFQRLEAAGISVAGKVVIVRYGEIFRGNKVELAEKFGAVACLIYSDPQMDGFVHGPVYPDGPWRPPSGAQRGSIWTGNGDPQTPGWPSTDSAPRLPIDDLYYANNTYGTPLSKIPSLPLSYGDAQPLLQSLKGLPVFNADWQGGLNFTYHIGPGPAKVRVFVGMNNTSAKIWNVIGKIPGCVEPDRLVILGNHRDAWTFGGGDPSSGTATMLEVARVFGQMRKNGWCPQRTIWFCSWDAEEYALVGSVEFTELHEKKLMQNTVAYLNVDIATEGGSKFRAEGMPSLNGLVQSVVSKVSAPEGSPETAKTIHDLWPAPTRLMAQDMGTGSDYGSFIQHLGIPSIDLRFQPDEKNEYMSVYHSIYDDYRWMSTFGDPHFQYMRGIAQTWGLLALRLSNMKILPFNYTEYGVQLVDQLEILKKQAVDSGLNLNFRTLDIALDGVVKAGKKLEEDIHARLHEEEMTPLQLRQLNDKLMLAERSFLFLQGFRGREWYRHVVWVTGLFDGYASVAFASVADAITQKQAAEAQHQIEFVSVVVEQMAQSLVL